MIRGETVDMTIQEPREQQELGSTMFQNLGVVASRKPSQWPPPFTSLYHLMAEQPGPPQEMDLADDLDHSASRPSRLSPNDVPAPSQARHDDNRREKVTMLPLWGHNTRVAIAAPPSRSLDAEFEAAGNPTEKASNFWNYPASFREQREFPAQLPASNEEHHHAWILSHPTAATCRPPEPNTEQQRDAAQSPTINKPAQEPRKMFSYIQKLDQPREFHHQQLSDVPAIYRSCHTEPSTPPNLMEKIPGSETDSACLKGTPPLTSPSITGEHEDGASSPNKLWSISPRLNPSTLIWGSVTGNHRPGIQQESDWVLSSMPLLAYHSRAAADIMQGFMERQEPRAPMMQTENSDAQGNSGNSQRGPVDRGLQNNQSNPGDHTRYTISEPVSHLSPHTPGPQYYQGSQTSTLLADLQGQISNTALLQRITAYNPDPFRLDADQDSITQQSFTSNPAMSHHVRNFDVNQSTHSSPSPFDVQNDKAAVATSPHCSSEKGSHDAVTLDSHSCDLEPGAQSACKNTSKNDVTPGGGKVGVVISSRRLSTLRMEMRKGSLSDKIEEPPPKQKRKKVRCKVLRDKTKPRVRKGQKTATKDTANHPTNLEGDDNQVLQDVNATGTNEFDSSVPTLVEQHPEELICGEGHDAIGSLDHGAMVCIDESTSAGSGIPINQKESAIRADQSPVSHPDICQLVDFLGLSDEKCHSGDDNLISGDLVICSETHRPLSEESHELVPYDQKVVLPGEQHPHDRNALPLYLFSGETSSSASTELVVAHRGLQPATGPSGNILQLVLYDQKREIIASRAVRTYKKIRAKVQLDPESQRVWLQLENGGSPEVDTDPDKAKYWEKERENMKKRVDLFIRKMHFVQGDRRFSRWKGSIVDSVVGAFLTQNVSDHLSSSAFMAVASRFPPARKRENPDPCIGDVFAHKCQEERNGETIPLRIETGFSGSTNKQYPLRSGLDSNDSIVIDESTVNDVENSEITDSCKQTESGKRRICEPQSLIKTGYSCHYENLMTLYDQQSCGKLNRQSAMISSDDERNSICTFDMGGGENRIEDVSEAFRKSSPSRNNKVRRMLRFDNADKQESTSCSVSEINKHVGFSIFPETEIASDNISDQQSESESVIGSSSSVQSLQDSNYNLQLTATRNYHAEIVQANSQESDAPQVQRNGKKRSLSVSSMSGIERAQLEANQKGRKKNHHRDWESVRREVLGIPTSAKNNTAEQRTRPPDHEDSANWDAVRLAELGDLAETIKERGMHHVLSGRIKAFLTSLYEDHGSIDLEWLRNLSTEMAREYLMSVHGLGVKSVECIRLLTLHHLAFPVDTNVGRICVRLGWVPIEPLPEEVQLHLVELYPIQETIQKYLWPRLCTLDQRTLYELHYQLITFGKVFCTKSKPNCNACPLRTECKHFASAYASAKPLLTGPKEDKNESISSGAVNEEFPALNVDVGTALLDYPQEKSIQFTWSHEAPLVSEIETSTKTQFDQYRPSSVASYSENFYVEMPASPEQTYEDDLMDIEDMGTSMYIYKNYNDYSLDLIGENISVDESGQSLIAINDELISQEVRISYPTIQKTATFNIPPPSFPKSNHCSPHQCSNNEITSASHIPSCESKCNTSSNVACTPTHQTDIVEISENAIVAVPEAAQIPAPKLKNVGRLRTIHYVYEIPDDHCLLKSVQVDVREKDDPCSYLLAIWSPGETPGSQQDIDEYCRDEFSLQASDHSSGDDETVAGTLLIPCRTAMHGNFPLNGTYFQVNEVFADHESSMNPLQVPRSLIWSLRRRFVYFGTSVPNIFKGLSTDEIKDCFWRGFVCVRGFDRQSRAPKPLVCRLHFPISKQPQKATKQQRKKNDEK